MLVLYVDDDIDDFQFFAEVIESMYPTIKCIHAYNGQTAIEYLDKAVVIPDYIFLDLNMPVMDGKACLREIRKQQSLNETP